MRILVLNQYFHPDRSATSQLLTELCEDLSEDDDVFVVTGRPSYNAVDDTHVTRAGVARTARPVRVARVWSTSFDRSNMAGRLDELRSPMSRPSLVGALSVRRPDVIVALTDPPPIGLMGLIIARLRRRPFVLVVKDIFPGHRDRTRELFRNPLAIALLRRLQRSSVRGRGPTRLDRPRHGPAARSSWACRRHGSPRSMTGPTATPSSRSTRHPRSGPRTAGSRTRSS